MGSLLPATNLEYSDPEYWNRRFKSEDHYEWLGGYHTFQHLIRRDLHPDNKILVR